MNDVKYRDAVKILKKNGYIHQYQTGDHHIFSNSDGRKITLPFHKNRNNECSGFLFMKEVKRKNLTI